MYRWTTLLLAATVLSACGNTSVPVTITAMTWARSTYVERWQEVSEEGWTVPSDAVRVTSTESKVKSTYRYACGTNTHQSTTYRNGKSVPVITTEIRYCTGYNYADWYTYDIWRWKETGKVFTAQGDQRTRPFWPDASDINDTDKANPERKGRNLELNTIIARDTSGRDFTINTTEAIWLGCTVGDHAELSFDFFGNVTTLSPKGGD